MKMFKPSCRTNKRNRYTECKQTQRRFEHKRRESHWYDHCVVTCQSTYVWTWCKVLVYLRVVA